MKRIKYSTFDMFAKTLHDCVRLIVHVRGHNSEMKSGKEEETHTEREREKHLLEPMGNT